jgi:hypothetical protein
MGCLACGRDAAPHTFCATCAPVMAGHVVSMQTAPGELLAVCPCGWTFRTDWTPEGHHWREAAVRRHWRAKSTGLFDNRRPE